MTSATEHPSHALEAALEHHKEGKVQEALTLYQTLLDRFPGHPQVLYCAGLACQDLGHLDRATELISRALTIDPGNGAFHCALGVLLKTRGKSHAALERLRDAQRRDPNRAEIFFHLGDTYMDLGTIPEAIACFREAIRLRPLLDEAWMNLGLCLKADKQLEEALACFQTVIDHQPNHVEGHVNLGLTHLLMGHYQAGWHAYEWRLKLEGEEFSVALEALAHHPPPPRWDGSCLAGKTLLVLSEQGFGDVIHFVRYLAPLKTTGARILLTAPLPLIPLLQTLPSVDRLLPPPRLGVAAFQSSVAQERIDAICPLLSLPRVLETRVATIPAPVPYLTADPEQVAIWQKRLAPHHTPRTLRIGLVWRGKPLHQSDPLRRRSCPLEALTPLAQQTGCTLFSLQKDPTPDGSPWHPPADMPLVDLKDGLSDFAQTAAALATMDLLITIDTAVAHLGGALGKPVWLLLPFAPDWRWFLDRDHTPWYPTLRLFRQTVANRWQEPVQQIVDALPSFLDTIMDS